MDRRVALLVKMGLSPDALTVIGLALAVVSAACYGLGAVLLGGVFLLFSGLMDMLDGSVARAGRKSTSSGALLDSTLDRYGEFFVFCGLLVHFRTHWMFFVVFLAMMGSVMVSYVKARAESLGENMIVGLAQRPERLTLLVAGSILDAPVSYLYPQARGRIFMAGIILLALLANATSLHRLWAGKKRLAGRVGEPKVS